MKGVTRTFDDFPSGSFLKKLSLCEHSILALSFADDDFDHGRGSKKSDSDKILLHLVVSPFQTRLSSESPHVAFNDNDKTARVASAQQCYYLGFFFCPLQLPSHLSL